MKKRKMAHMRWVLALICISILLSEYESRKNGRRGKMKGRRKKYPSWRRLLCRDEGACRNGMTCVKNKKADTFGRCMKTCRSHTQCRNGFVCINMNIDDQHKRCMFPRGCTADDTSHDDDGLVCTVTLWPKGRRRHACLPKCNSTTGQEWPADVCRSQEICVKSNGAGYGGCTQMKRCSRNSDCTRRGKSKSRYTYCQQMVQGKGHCISNGVERNEVIVDGDDVQLILV